ncbi:uncharacterized protein KY384_004833 [Bacidia gigantensis]|uniref:uncharacterized protein n=1 Tax=Bacidia gigantensis TaxID=2732470 RepID=UPI001D051B93|nr:uncharacterized protein KY384_004833 [Bacidia gigantensis]KAG8530331.1 hypothetical protein KY384_004833 [Bacidia gigantensis]
MANTLRAALASHPDKVPEGQRAAADEKFKSISQAYDILYNDQTRHLYDSHGMQAFEKGSGAAPGDVNLDDILAQMMGMGMGGGMPQGFGGPPRKPRRGKDEEQSYAISLEELYKGKTVKFASTKNVICTHCKGSGGKEKARAKKCSSCNGAGEVYGILYHRDGEKIRLEGEADQVPDQEPGDIVFTLAQSEHPTFERRGADILATIEVTLAEALCGFSRVVVKHLDGRGIHIRHPQPAARVLEPDQIIKVAGEGMPHKKSDIKGDLYLMVNVKFPDYATLERNQAFKKLRDILPKPGKPIEADEVDDVEYDETATLDGFGGAENVAGDWEDEDEDGTGPQCQQQ